MADNFGQNVDALFKGMEQYVSSKSVVGDTVRVGDTIILPLVDVSFGMMASSKNEPQRHNGGGGMGGKVSPNAVLVIKDGNTRLVNIKNADGLSKLMDSVPEIVSKLRSGKDPGINEAARQAAKDSEGTF